MAVGAVSVLGAQGHVHVLNYSATNLFIAQQYADKINTAVTSGKLIPSDDNTHPTISGGKHEYVQTQDGATTLPGGYTATVLDTLNATVHGSKATHQTVMGGAGNFDFSVTGKNASGTIVFGDGNDTVHIGASVKGSWLVSLGNGNDLINARGVGNETISVGTGNDTVILGAGKDVVITGGNTTVIAGSGTATLFGSDGGNFLHFVGGALSVGGSSGLSGADTFEFVNGSAGGTDVIKSFGASDKVLLSGYGQNEIANALASAQLTAQGLTVTLSDKTKIVFADITKMDSGSWHSG